MIASRSHTRAPWVVVKLGAYSAIQIHDREAAFDESGTLVGDRPNQIADVYVMPGGYDTQCANAALISAAPDLLEVVRRAVAADLLGDHLREAAIEALEKAGAL